MFGNVFVTTRSHGYVLDHPELIEHEIRHAEQWAAFGLTYPIFYGLETLDSLIATGTTGCANAFEQLADLEKGHYDC